jgi:hypothetical protein
MSEKNKQSEVEIMDNAWAAMVRQGAKLWRNNTGQAWQGERSYFGAEMILKHARPVRFGLCEGSSDLIGYLPITITPDMVGQRVAVFLAAEAKSLTSRPTPLQSAYIEAVKRDGGIGFIFKSTYEALFNLSQGPHA